MEDTEQKLVLCDKEPVGERKLILGTVFSRDIFTQEGLLKRHQVRGDVLDLGCGRGSVGAFLKSINPDICLTGVDIVTEYRGENAWSLYSERRRADAARIGDIFKGEQKMFDLIVSCGLPGEVIEKIIERGEIMSFVKPGGSILFIFDIPPIKDGFMENARNVGFKLHRGQYPINPYMLFWHNDSAN